MPILTFHLRGLVLGNDQVYLKTTDVIYNPNLWFVKLAEFKVTHTWAPNFGFKLLADAFDNALLNTIDLLSVKSFMNAGEQVTLAAMQKFYEIIKCFGLSAKTICPAYGMAEIATCISYNNNFDFSDHNILQLDTATDAKKNADIFINTGSICQGVNIRIVDANNDLVSMGSVGRLQVKGGVLFPGYLNRSNINLFVDDGWFNTSDLAILQHDQLYIVGREEESIIIRGINYHAHEIESEVESIGDVVTGLVGAFAVKNDASTDESLVVAYVPCADDDILEEEIKKRVVKRFGIVPNIFKVSEDAFPRTAIGKIQRLTFKIYVFKRSCC